jgi:iron complex outermembrane receptor protein
VTDFTAGGKTAYTNASQTRRQGLELSWQQVWDKHWRSDASITAMKAIYDATTPLPSGSTPTITSGNRLPAIPDRLGFVALHWSQSGWGSASVPMGWLASVEWMGRSRLWANDTNNSAAPGYVTNNLRLRYRQSVSGGYIEPYLAIENLNDRHYVGSVIVNQSSKNYFEPALPRTWVLGLQAKWAL